MFNLPPPPVGVDPERYHLSNEFMDACFNIFNAHLAAVHGLYEVRSHLCEFQEKLIAELKSTNPEHATIEFLDTQTVEHRLEADEREPEQWLFSTTQGELKTNTAPFGPFERFLGRMAVTFLYATWEDRFRGRFAALLGFKEPSELKNDLFGDLGRLRNACIHNHGIATREVANKSRILQCYKEGQEILISTQHVHILIKEVDHFCTRFCGIKQGSHKP